MFVTAIVIKDGAHRFIDGEDRELNKGYEMRLDNIDSVWVNFQNKGTVQINTFDGISWTFDPDYWFVSVVSEHNPLFDTEGA